MTIGSSRATRQNPELAEMRHVHRDESEQILAAHDDGHNPETKGKQRAFTSNGAGRCIQIGLSGRL